MSKKILILAGGGVKSLLPFVDEAKVLNLNLKLASFSKLEYITNGEVPITVEGENIGNFDIIYFRLVGKRFEDVALVVNYAKQCGVKIVDKVYANSGLTSEAGQAPLIRLPLPKSIEVKLLVEAGVPVPRTYFGRTKMMKDKAVKLFGFPFVIKETTGKQGHGVWSPRNRHELDKLIEKFTLLEKSGKSRFLAQEFIKASTRKRIFVIGERVVAGIIRPTRWRKRFVDKNSNLYEGIRDNLYPVDSSDANLAVSAASAVGVDIAGVDIITEDQTGKDYVLEVNSAPRWAALKKDKTVNIEKEILKYLSSI